MPDESRLGAALKNLFARQALGVLATHRAGQPYGSLVAIAATDDLRHVVFATTRATRKYANLMADARVAMVIDSRTNRESDFHQAVAATATGTVRELSGEEREARARLLLLRHPHLTEFVASPTCAVIEMKVDTYYFVERFQHVTELHMEKAEDSL